jgi:hypothetical protein
MELDLQNLFGLPVHSCSHWLRPRNPSLPALGLLYEVLASQDRRHLFVTPCLLRTSMTDLYLLWGFQFYFYWDG